MVGIGIAVSATAINIYLQLVADIEKRGRVLGLLSLCCTACFALSLRHCPEPVTQDAPATSITAPGSDRAGSN